MTRSLAVAGLVVLLGAGMARAQEETPVEIPATEGQGGLVGLLFGGTTPAPAESEKAAEPTEPPRLPTAAKIPTPEPTPRKPRSTLAPTATVEPEPTATAKPTATATPTATPKPGKPAKASPTVPPAATVTPEPEATPTEEETAPEPEPEATPTEEIRDTIPLADREKRAPERSTAKGDDGPAPKGGGARVAGSDVALPETEIQGELEKPDIFFLLPRANDQSDDQVIRARIRREITRPLIKDWLEEMMLLE